MPREKGFWTHILQHQLARIFFPLRQDRNIPVEIVKYSECGLKDHGQKAYKLAQNYFFQAYPS